MPECWNPLRWSAWQASPSCRASRDLRAAAFASAHSRRHRDTAACSLLVGTAAVVREAAGQIANATVRNMGTIGGSISFADPGLDYPPALVAAGASHRACWLCRSKAGVGEANSSSTGTSLRWSPGKSSPRFSWHPPTRPGQAYTSSIHGCLAITPRLPWQPACRPMAACAWSSVAAGLLRSADDGADTALSSSRDDATIARAGAALQSLADPLDDVRGSADYRRQLIPRLLLRAVRAAEVSRGVRA